MVLQPSTSASNNLLPRPALSRVGLFSCACSLTAWGGNSVVLRTRTEFLTYFAGDNLTGSIAENGRTIGSIFRNPSSLVSNCAHLPNSG